MQKTIHLGSKHFRIREEKNQVSKVQKHQGQTADHTLSGRNLKEGLISFMECPHCHIEIPSKKCTECGTAVPFESHYCMTCGVKLGEEAGDMMIHEDSFDFENRILCPDGTCTGIIIDGKCTDCGKPYKA